MRSFNATARSAAIAAVMSIVLAACGATTPAASTAIPGAATAAPAGTTAADATTAPAEATTAPVEATTAPATGGAKGPIAIGSKDFTEAILVAELYAQLLENNGYTIERKLSLGATPIAQEALVKGDIDLYPEYTSTGLQEVLQITDRFTDSQAIVERVRSEYESKFQLTWLDPSPFNNTNIFAVTQAVADQYGLKTYTDLAAKAGELRLGAPAEFQDRTDTKGLDAAYGGFVASFKEIKALGTGGLRYDALAAGEVDVIVAFGTDGRVAGDKLVTLEDDKSFYPIYNIAPVIRQDTLAANADIATILNSLAPLLTAPVMSGLNYEVDGPDKREVGDVAKDFLTASGLLK